jgi:hypothetical protein
MYTYVRVRVMGRAILIHCWWKCKLVQPLWKSVMEVPQNTKSNQGPVAHSCNPSYSGGRDQEDRSLKPAGQVVLRPYLKNPS